MNPHHLQIHKYKYTNTHEPTPPANTQLQIHKYTNTHEPTPPANQINDKNEPTLPANQINSEMIETNPHQSHEIFIKDYRRIDWLPPVWIRR